MNIHNQDLIHWMQEWYLQYCDEDWEHNEHFIVRNIDNPGWCVTINLEGTHCEGKTFNSIEVEKSENDWHHCFIRDGKFEGAGGPRNLINILVIFKNWANRCQESQNNLS